MKANYILVIVSSYLSRYGYKLDVVGGYARDVFYKLTPKDIDVCVSGGIDYAPVFETMKTLSDVLARHHISSEVMQGYDGTCRDQFNEMLYGVLKVKCSDYDVDLLFSKLEDTQSYVDAFECNINQYKLVYGIPHYAGKPEDNPTECKSIIFLRNDTPTKRIDKMLDKWDAIQESEAYNESTSSGFGNGKQ